MTTTKILIGALLVIFALVVAVAFLTIRLMMMDQPFKVVVPPAEEDGPNHQAVVGRDVQLKAVVQAHPADRFSY
ncbi:MAG: hypothetical protein R6U98_03270, partial [Pirellulaceae bacterium]